MIYVNTRFLTQQVTGVQRFSFEIYKHLSELRSDMLGVMPVAEIQDTYTVQNSSIKKIGKYAGPVWEQLSLPSYLRKNNSPLLLGLGNMGPISYKNQVVTIHDLAFLFGNWHSFAFRNFYKYAIPLLAKRSKHVLTVSEFSKQEIIKHYAIPEKKVSVIYNAPFNAEEILNFDKSTSSSTVSNEKYILCVGSIDPRKNLKSVIKAFLKLKETNIKLFLIGKFNRNFSKDLELDQLINENAELIQFLGYVSDQELKSYYANAIAFVYPSLYEGFGLPPIEAMALGCPVITSSRCSLPEVCGDAAIYCNPDDVNDIFEKLHFLVNNATLRETLSAKGILQAQKFSWGQSAQKLNALLNQI